MDVYLKPLIDNLNKLWNGALEYNISRKQNFMMRTTLMWTINHFPTCEMLFCWDTHGRLAFAHCMDHNNSFTLSYGCKSCWFHLHNKFLPNDH